MKTEMMMQERKKSLRSRSEGDQRFQRLLSATTDYIYTVHLREGTAESTTHGPGCEGVTGYTSREFSRDPYLWFRIVYEDDRSLVLRQAQEILTANGKPHPLEHRIVHKDGRIRWIRNTCIPRVNSRGELESYDGLIKDITTEKVLEQARRDSEERLSLIIEGSTDGVWDWNIRTNETFFSTQWKGMLGYEDHELANTFETWKGLIHPADRDRALHTLEQAFKDEGVTYVLEHRLRHKDGSYRWILARGVVRSDGEGHPIRMAGSHVDITERRLAGDKLKAVNRRLQVREKALRRLVEWLKARNEQLKEAREELHRLKKAEFMSILAAGVAHEIRNPLQALLGGVDYLEHRFQNTNEGLQSVIHDMRVGVRRANKIIQRINPPEPQVHLNCTEVDLNSLVEESLALVRKDLCTGRIDLRRELGSHLPTVCVDTDKIVEVFINLILNAIHAMPNGGTITLRTRTVPCGGGADHPLIRPLAASSDVVIAEVQDGGSGIDAIDLPHIFEMFWRKQSRSDGTGMGLPIVKQLVELHHGRIDIANHPGGGVIATLILPATAGTRSWCQTEGRKQ